MNIWTDIREWIAEEDRLIAQGYDSITVYTGEEGTGKSYTMVGRNMLCDPTFFAPGAWSEGWQPTLPTDRVVFEEDDFRRLAPSLAPGSAIQIDELDAHRRGATTRKRRKLLKFLKERRRLRLRIGIGYPHVDQIDRDILRSRVRYRAHVEWRRVNPVTGQSESLLVVRRRTVIREEEDRLGNPRKVIKWPIVGRFTIPDISGFPVTKAYDKKKDAFTTREDDDLEDLAEVEEPELIDREAALPVVERILAATKPAMPVNLAFVDQVLNELKA